MRLLLERYERDKKQTNGRLFVLDINDYVVDSFYTLELGWNDNKRRISCIPQGKYNVVPRTSKKYKNHLHIKNVPNRDYILIHPANYHTQLLGCIAIGMDIAFINNDNYIDVAQSRKAMKRLLKYVKNSIELEVVGLF